MRGVYIGNNKMLITPVWGSKLIVPSEDLSLSPFLILDGHIELPLTNYLIKNVKPGDTVFDVGANIGYFTILMGLLVGPEGKVLAYEPNSTLCSFLKDNLSINFLHDRSIVFEKAVFSSARKIPLYLAKRFMGNTSINCHGEEYFKHYVDEILKVEVEAEPLDIHLGQMEQVDLIKLDIEGGEYQAFRGMQEMIKRKIVKTIIFELNKSMLEGDWGPLTKLLLKFNKLKHISFYTLSTEGDLIDVNVNQLIAQGSEPYVVMKLAEN